MIKGFCFHCSCAPRNGDFSPHWCLGKFGNGMMVHICHGSFPTKHQQVSQRFANDWDLMKQTGEGWIMVNPKKSPFGVFYGILTDQEKVGSSRPMLKGIGDLPCPGFHIKDSYLVAGFVRVQTKMWRSDVMCGTLRMSVHEVSLLFEDVVKFSVDFMANHLPH